MIEKPDVIADTIAQLRDALTAMNALSKQFFNTRENNRRPASLRKFDSPQKAFVDALDECNGDVEKLRQLQEQRRHGNLELEIRVYNERLLERLLERAAYRVKELIRKALVYYERHSIPFPLDRIISINIGVIVEATEAVQNVNARMEHERRTYPTYGRSPALDEEHRLVVASTFALLKQSVIEATSNRPNGHYDHDSVFDTDAYKPDAYQPGQVQNRLSNWSQHNHDGLRIEALPENLAENLPSAPLLHATCVSLAELEGKFISAISDLDRHKRFNDFNSPDLSIALQRAQSDEDFKKVAKARTHQGDNNLAEYRVFRNLLAAALALRDERAQAARLMRKVINEVAALDGVSRYWVDRTGDHFTIGVYLLHYADRLLQSSGATLDSVGKNRALKERYLTMQNEVQAHFARISKFAKEQMF